MSEENVELARQYVATFNSRGLDGVEELWHPDIEVFDPPAFPDADHHVGTDAVRTAILGYLDIGWDGRFREPEFIDAGDEVLVVWMIRAEAAHGGGLSMETPLSHLYRFEDGKLRRIRQFMGRDEGLRAAGLSE
jgi:ketosteroid isomerase-like protein